MRSYLDHNATSTLRAEARAAFLAALSSVRGNPSSVHEEGRDARALLESARREVARLAGVPARDLVFTSGASEAIAAGVFGISENGNPARRRVVVASIEHSSVLESARALRRRGFEVLEVACPRAGRIDPSAAAALIDERVALVALQAANNETGVIQPVAEVGAMAAAAGAAFLVDAVQAAGKIPIERDLWNASLIAISGHKLGGPAGTGALIVRDGFTMAPLVPGGAQERRRRGGTEPVAALAAFGAACAAAAAAIDDEAIRLRGLRDALERGIAALAPDAVVHGAAVPRLPNTVGVSIPGVSGETLVIALDLAGIAASTGSACASGAVLPSHVLIAMGVSPSEARGAVRFSLGWNSTENDVSRLLEALPAIVDRARMAAR